MEHPAIAESLVGRRIGTITVEEKIGAGGMGDVYSGFDEKLQRHVALKAIHSQRPGSVAKARFLREARALSKLNHPNICSIYDFLEDGRAEFLVLELVVGRGLKQAIDHGLHHADKLRISRQLAEALTVAHSRAIVHRDLKPDNVMLSDEGDVKVLDFGLAQIHGATATLEAEEAADPQSLSDRPPADAEATVADPLTAVGGVAGTAAFMSPEQALGLPVVPASDIYSLGLLLQQLWTERSPHEKGQTKQQLLLKAAAAVSLPPTGIDKDVAELIRRMKSPAPDARPSAAQVVDRLRWIERRPQRRLRAGTAALLLLAVIAAGAKYATDLRRERNAAVAAQTAEAQSRREAEEVVRFLVELFEVTEPGTAQGNSVTAREILDVGADKIAMDLEAQPLVRARLSETIGTVYSQLGLFDEAESLLEDSLERRRALLGSGHPEVAASLDALGTAVRRQGRMEEAEPLLEEALAIRENALAPNHPDLERSLNNLGLLYWQQGRYQEAEAIHRRALNISLALHGPDHADVASSLNNLGEVIREQGRLDEADALLRRSYEIKKAELGDTHPDLASSMNNLGQLSWQRKHFEDAEVFFTGALRINEHVFGADNVKVVPNLNNLATLYDDQGRTLEAEEMYLKALAITEKAVGAKHPTVAVGLNNLAELYKNSGRPDEAEEAFARALEFFEESLGEDHPYVAYPLDGLSELARDRGELREAEALLRRALAIREARLGPEHPMVTETRTELESLLEEMR